MLDPWVANVLSWDERVQDCFSYFENGWIGSLEIFDNLYTECSVENYKCHCFFWTMVLICVSGSNIKINEEQPCTWWRSSHVNFISLLIICAGCLCMFFRFCFFFGKHQRLHIFKSPCISLCICLYLSKACFGSN